MKTKRAALVYSGQPRNLKECWPNHRATFIDANPDWEFDVFAHLWFDDSWERDADWNRLGYGDAAVGQRQKTLDSAKDINALDANIKEYIREQWLPKSIRFEAPRRFDHRKLGVVGGKNPAGANNALSMFYGIEQANKLKQTHEQQRGFQYDCVIRMRTDILFLEPVGALDNYDLAKINLRRHIIPGYQIDDRFAFANSGAMDKFCAVFTNIADCAGKNLAGGKEMENTGDVFNPHEVLGYHAEVVQGLQIEKHHILVEMHRLRHFGMAFSNTPKGKEPIYRLRLQSIKSILGEDAANALQAALRLDLGLSDKKIPLAQLYALYCAYPALLPSHVYMEKFKVAIKNALQSLTCRRGDKAPAKYVWHYYRYKLKALAKSKTR